MNGVCYTNILFEVGEYSSEEGEDRRWNPREDCGHTLMFKTSMEEITYSVLVDKICRKISIDKCSKKVILSYISLVVKPQKRVYINDDEDVHVYLNSVDREQCRSVLYVEISSELGGNLSNEEFSRLGGRSSVGLNYGARDDGGNGVSPGRNDVNIAGECAITLYAEKEPTQQQNEAMDEGDVRDRRQDGDQRQDVPMEDVVDDGLDSGLHSFDFDDHVELRRDVVGCEYVEEWGDGLDLAVGTEFPNKKAVTELVAKASQQNCFGILLVKSDKTRYVVRCQQAGEGCLWYLRATKVKMSECFTVRVYNGKHKCSRATSSTSIKKTRGTPGLVAAILHQDYPGCFETPTPKIIRGLVQGRLGVEISYSTAWRGKKQAVVDVRGSPEQCYEYLYSYLYILEQVNPGTVTNVQLDREGKFKYLFVALGASIEGFQAMRKVIIVDATFLKTSYGGMLLFATAQDPNHHHYPIAFGVIVGRETHASWGWFFKTLKTVVPDSPELVFVSDRHGSIIKSVMEVYPLASHGYCIFHLSQNVKGSVSYVHKESVADEFRKIAEIYEEAEFRKRYNQFRIQYPAAAVYLDDHVEEEKWARCLFKGVRYDVDTSNVAESMNSVFKETRKYSLLPLIDEIICKFSEWFNKYRKESAAVSTTKKLVPFVENKIHKDCKKAAKLHVDELNSYTLEYSVKTEDGPYFVDLNMKTCSCKRFDIDKYPCVHAIAALGKLMGREDRIRDMSLYELCSKYYLIETWVLAYYRTIYPVPHRSQWCVPDYVKEKTAKPPKKKDTPGRNQETRFPSGGERRRRRRKRPSNKSNPDIDLENWRPTESDANSDCSEYYSGDSEAESIEGEADVP